MKEVIERIRVSKTGQKSINIPKDTRFKKDDNVVIIDAEEFYQLKAKVQHG